LSKPWLLILLKKPWANFWGLFPNLSIWFVTLLTLLFVAEPLETLDLLCPPIFKNLELWFPLLDLSEIWSG
jgi:hypothetical protein